MEKLRVPSVNGADRLRETLESRRLRRAENMAGIQAKLDTLAVWPRKRARLERELGFLRTYNARHHHP